MVKLSRQTKRAKRSLRLLSRKANTIYRVDRSIDGTLRPNLSHNSGPLLSQIIRLARLIPHFLTGYADRRLVRYVVWKVFPKFLLSKKFGGVLKNYFWHNYRYAKLLLKVPLVVREGSIDPFEFTVVDFRVSSRAIAPKLISCHTCTSNSRLSPSSIEGN